MKHQTLCFTNNDSYIEKINGENEKCKLCIMGQCYRRSFFEEYSIRFCNNDIASRKMEDIAINTLCWFCQESSPKDIRYLEYPVPVCIKIEDEKSITCADQAAHNYRDTNIGYAINFEYCLEVMDYLKKTNKIILPNTKRKCL